jgi:hypothetical protein
MPFCMRNSMAKIFFNAVMLMAILQLAGPSAPAAAKDLNRGGGTIHGMVQAARIHGVPDKVLSDLLARAVDRKVAPDRVRALLGMLTEVRQEGLPMESFLGKIDEALAKGVNPAQLEAKLHERIADYKFVMRVLEEKYPQGPSLEGPELSAVVDCLDLGLSRETLSDFLRRAPATRPAMLAIAAQNYALLQQIGFDSELGDELLRFGMAHRCLTSRWAGLFKAAAAAKRKGISDQRFAAAVEHVWKTHGDPHQVLQELGFTLRDVRRGPGSGPMPEAHRVIPASEPIQNSTR